eukprot:1250121-Amphidinium_carterae.1
MIGRRGIVLGATPPLVAGARFLATLRNPEYDGKGVYAFGHTVALNNLVAARLASDAYNG